MILRLMLAFIMGLILTIIPLPQLIEAMRPPWILLIVLYIQFYMPRYFKITLLFILGLLLDSLLSTVIGEHVFCLCFVAWLASSRVRRFALFPISQQMMYIALFSVIYQLMLVIIDSFLGYTTHVVAVIGAALSGTLVWPWIRLLGDEFLLTAKVVRRKYTFRT